MGTPIVQVDAFTAKPFAGNPAAVCVLPEARDEVWMRNVAAEMNLSETAFLHPEGDGYRIRWFTPTVEVDLCGHATLASAHVLWEDGHLPPTLPARFHTRSGLLTAERRDEWIWMDFPAKPIQPASPPDGLLETLGVTARYFGGNGMDFLVETDSEESVRGMSPDFCRLRKIPVRGVIVTSRSASSEYDFISRFFAPGSGIDEDPVTGSAHCALAPFWRKQLEKDAFVAYQASKRGGVVRAESRGNRILLGGQAVTVLRGELRP